MSAESAAVLVRRKLLSGSRIVANLDRWIRPLVSLVKTSKLNISVPVAVVAN
jgi:hypothetical protein